METEDTPPTRRALRDRTTGATGEADAAGDEAAPDHESAPDEFDLAALFDEPADTATEEPATSDAIAPDEAVPADTATEEPAHHDDIAPDEASMPFDRTTGPSGEPERPAALGWVDEGRIQHPHPSADLAAAASPYVPVTADLLPDDEPLRSPLRRRVVLALSTVAVVVVAYLAATLLWPLNAVAPTIAASAVTSVAAPAAAPAWPADGTASVAVEGIETLASANADVRSIASITKVVTALLVLEVAPLEAGESGPSFEFTWADSQDYWSYLYRNESALDVPVGGTLSELELLQGMLIGSANNYADRLASEFWDSEAAFVADANAWLADHDLSGITITDPTGIDAGNTADAASLVRLGEIAMADPVVAPIVGTETIELPGAGEVENTNELLADSGVLGIKTGWLDAFNLLSAKEILVGTTPVRMYAAVLGQLDEEARFDTSRELYLSVQQELVPLIAVPAGTVAGVVETAWGDRVDVVTAADAKAILWNGAAASTEPAFELGEARDEGDVVGSLAVTGPLDSTAVDLALADDVDGPSAWWRLTHPLQLWGLVD